MRYTIQGWVMNHNLWWLVSLPLKDTPTICFLAKMWSEVIIWSFHHTWYHYWSFPVTMTSFLKNFKKLLISRFSVSEWFLRSENVIIVISSKNAAKWCVTWPFFEYDLENPQFDHYFRNFIRTSGSKICWSQNKYFSNQCKKCFNLRYNFDNLSVIFSSTLWQWEM